MKKFFMIAVMAVAALTASAQTSDEGTVTLTPYAGVSFGSYNESVELLLGSQPKYDSKNHTGFTIGAEVGYQVNSWFKASAGLAFANIGSEAEYSSQLVSAHTAMNFSANYLNIPILANFYVADGLALKVGVQPAILLSAKETKSDIKFKDYMNAFDLQIPMGISYEYSNFVLDARYNLGVLKVFKKDDVERDFSSYGSLLSPSVYLNDVKNQYFTITLGYKLGL